MTILSKVRELPPTGELVFGLAQSGKTTYVIEQLAKYEKVLWIFTNNAGELTKHEEAQDWIAAEVNDVDDMREVLSLLNQPDGPLAGVEAACIDGLEGLRDFALEEAARQSQQAFVTQKDWGVAGQEMSALMRQLRSKVGVLYGITNVVWSDDQNGYRLALNPDARDKMMQLFGDKIHTFTSGERDPETEQLILNYNVCKGEEATRLVNLY